MAAFTKLLKILAKYGKKAVDYAWAHKAQILRWLAEMGVMEVVDRILNNL